MASTQQIQLNLSCIWQDINHVQFKKIAFHWRGAKRGLRQYVRELLRPLGKTKIN